MTMEGEKDGPCDTRMAAMGVHNGRAADNSLEGGLLNEYDIGYADGFAKGQEEQGERDITDAYARGRRNGISEGFSKAREMAAKVCEAEARVFQRGSPQGHVLTNAAASIRAMQEEDR